MGYSEMTAASAPTEDAKKCWLKITYQGRTRMVEWNTSLVNFKDLDSKVKKTFGLGEKLKLIFSYQGVDNSEIVMSSDEELSSAMHFMNGEVLLVNLTLERKKKKGFLTRTLRAAKTQGPAIVGFVSRLPANAYAQLPHVNFSACAERLRASAQGFARCACPHRREPANADASGNARPAPPRGIRAIPYNRKVLCFLLFMALGLLVAHARDVSRIKSRDSHVTILYATYGGKDVTRTLQDYYNLFGYVKSSNGVFGDPTLGHKKFLHVVYQHMSSKTGLAEVFSQTFPESEEHVRFSMSRENCAFPEEAIVDGRSVKVLGALYDDVGATCTARRYAATGRLSASSNYCSHHKDSLINRNHFGSNSAFGTFTLVYLKDNHLRTFVGREGNNVIF